MFAATSFFTLSSLLAPLLLSAGTLAHPPLTVLVDFELPHSETSLASLRHSLSQLLSPGGFAIDIQLKSNLSDSPQFGQLVIFKMKGSCSLLVSEPRAAGPIYDERGPLAMAYVSNGEVLHFGEVECDRVRHSLQRILGRNQSLKSQQTFGSALAIVMAHEVYHMLGNARQHTHDGLTKSELSASELMDSRLSLPHSALSAILERSVPASVPGK